MTRHSTSCNNRNLGKWYTRGKDFEPSITSFSILQMLALKHRYQYIDSKRFDSNKVFVSSLLRTWCTATILYGSEIVQPDDTKMDAVTNVTKMDNLIKKLHKDNRLLMIVTEHF